MEFAIIPSTRVSQKFNKKKYNIDTNWKHFLFIIFVCTRVYMFGGTFEENTLNYFVLKFDKRTYVFNYFPINSVIYCTKQRCRAGFKRYRLYYVCICFYWKRSTHSLKMLVWHFHCIKRASTYGQWNNDRPKPTRLVCVFTCLKIAVYWVTYKKSVLVWNFIDKKVFR